jgi:nucleotide-binding universal stress UspA family protein
MDWEVAVKKVLAPIDRSKYKEKIIAYAISLGKAWGAEITAIHVIDLGRGVPGGRVKEKEEEREEEAKRVQSVDPLAHQEGVNI